MRWMQDPPLQHGEAVLCGEVSNGAVSLGIGNSHNLNLEQSS